MNSKRINIILNQCKNKSVLDIGCINHNSLMEENNDWLHKRIKSVAKELEGLDYLKEDAEILNRKGYKIHVANAENFNFKKKYDVIVAGEIIEHILNVGSFLDSIKKHMKKDSKLIITTPNCFSYRRFIGMFLFGKLRENPEHVAYYSGQILVQLLKRKGFKVEKLLYLSSEDKSKFKFVERFLDKIFRNELRNRLLLIVKLK